ncbi:MAG: transcriptional regulator [Marmoricola sp.]
MEVERVQRWVMSTLLMTVAVIFAGGLALLSSSSVQAGARPGLLTMSAVVGVLGVGGVRVINGRSVLTPWLVLGLVPAVLGWLVTR